MRASMRTPWPADNCGAIEVTPKAPTNSSGVAAQKKQTKLSNDCDLKNVKQALINCFVQQQINIQMMNLPVNQEQTFPDDLSNQNS